MSHNDTALRVSQDEANRSYEASTRRLLTSRKLSLVVDLDQTIIHTVCDPTIGEWQKDPSNPNYDALKDVESFDLKDDAADGGRTCTYYVKKRPGLTEFLRDLSQKYEMHIYTMGTRSYAENIAKIVDPDRSIFNDRILSRDESGSMTAKHLHRLFPVDTKMVVIIDDRGDVWQWCPNLARVRAYNFYVGIGDINSSFLPKLTDLVVANDVPPAEDGRPPIVVEDVEDEPIVPHANGNTPHPSSDKSIEEQLVMMAGNHECIAKKDLLDHQSTIESQLVERPLLRKQEQLDKDSDVDPSQSSSQESSPPTPESESVSETHPENTTDIITPSPPPADTTASNHDGPSESNQRPSHPQQVSALHAHSTHRHALLHNNDEELVHVHSALTRIHQDFYTEYDRAKLGSTGPSSRVAALQKGGDRKRPLSASKSKTSPEDLKLVPDVKTLMPKMKQSVLSGCVLCFTGVIPQGIDHASSDIGLWAISFGARISPQLTRKVTHVIADRTRRTTKVRIAARHPDLMTIVERGWLLECFSRWTLVDLTPYILQVKPNGAHNGDLPDGPALERDDLDPCLSDDEGTAGSLRSGVPSDEEPDEEEDDLPDIEGVLEGMEDEDFDEELREFMGSDVESEATEEESESGNVFGESRSASGANGVKRPFELVDGGGLVGVESELQERKKRALGRTSSLTKGVMVLNHDGEAVDSDSHNLDNGSHAHAEGDKRDRPAGRDHRLDDDGADSYSLAVSTLDHADEDDSDDDSTFEKQMLKAFEEGLDDDDGDEGDDGGGGGGGGARSSGAW